MGVEIMKSDIFVFAHELSFSFAEDKRGKLDID